MGVLIGLLIWIALGGVIGWAASRLMGDRLSAGWCVVIGITGSFLGGWLARLLGLAGGLIVQLLIAIAGACLLLLIVRALRRA